MHGYPPFTAVLAKLHAAEGDYQAALAMLEQAIDEGFRNSYLLNLAVWNPVREDVFAR